jgi:hypothetical protein
LYPDIHSEVMCSCDWRIGTLYLYPNPLQCLIQLGLEDWYIPLVPRSTPVSRPAGIGGSVHFSCTQIHSNVFCSGGWRIGTLRLYLPVHCSLSHAAVFGGSVHSACTQIHSNVFRNGGWRIGTICLYLPIHCSLSRAAVVGGSVHSACTQIHSIVLCSWGWRIGTFICTCLFTVHCHILLWLEDRYILLVPRSTPRSYTNLISLFRSRPIAWLCDIPDFT